jgi:hypothetical protein
MAGKSRSVTEAIDRTTEVLERIVSLPVPDIKVVEAIDRSTEVLKAIASLSFRNIEYPLIAFPLEHVLAFNNNEHSFLRGIKENKPYFTSNGTLSDLNHNLLPGSKVQSTFPVELSKFLSVFGWPHIQPEPFDNPGPDNILDTTNADPVSFSKQAYFFGDGSSLVTVGPSIPKISLLKDGGAQFWVSSVGVISQGTGKYEGAQGMSVYTGSAYLKNFPLDPKHQIPILEKGFDILVGTYFKLVLKSDQRPS